MNPFVALLALLLVVAWVVSGVALIVIPVGYLRSASDIELFERTFAWVAIAGGLALLLAFGAMATGGIMLDSRPDGCYYVHRELVGKTTITKYDPVECHGVPVP